MASNKHLKLSFLIVPVFGIVLGLAVTVWGVQLLRAAWETATWPQTSGVITQSEIKTSYRDRTPTHSASVAYEYSVGGASYIGSRISRVDFSSSNRDHSEQLINRYPVDALATVYYDPSDPSQSVLDPGVGLGNWTVLIVGVGFIVVCTILLVVGNLIHAKQR